MRLRRPISSLVNSINVILREADIIAMDGPDEFFIFLPETDYWGALLTQRRIQRLLKPKLVVNSLQKSLPIKVVLRSASCSVDGNSYKQLTETAEARLQSLDSSLIFKYGLEDLSFWEAVDKLMGRTPEAFSDALGYRSDCHVQLTEECVERVLGSFCRELVEANRVRGFIYHGCGNFEKVRGQLPHPGLIERSATSVFLLGGKPEGNLELPAHRPHLYFGTQFHRIAPFSFT